jgi:hypothetical protein
MNPYIDKDKYREQLAKLDPETRKILEENDIDNLLAGRELDRRIVLDVMGWKPWESPYAEGPSGRTYFISDDQVDYDFPDFKPSRDIAAAWEVVAKIQDLLENFTMVFNSDRGRGNNEWRIWKQELGPEENEEPLAGAPTAPLAICRAALKAVQK